MRKQIYAFAFALFLSLTSFHVYAQERPGENPPAEEQKQPISLLGVAKLQYTPAEERYEDWKTLPKSWSPEFLLLTDYRGKPSYCQPTLEGIDAKLLARLCADLMANAKVELFPGYALGGREGIIAVNKEPFTQLTGFGPNNGEFASPFSFGIKEFAPTEFTDYEPKRPAEFIPPDGAQVSIEVVGDLPDYPRDAMVNSIQGTSVLLLQVDGDADIKSCRPIKSSGYSLLDNTACKFALTGMKATLNEGVYPAEAPFYYGFNFTWRINK